jgi:hypothetical protein
LERIHRDIREQVKRKMGMILLVDHHFKKKSGMFEVIIKRNALTKTLGIHKVCNNQVKVTNNPSQ